MSVIQELIRNLIDREGGFVNHPNDRGGPTKYGITIRTLSTYRGRTCTLEDVANLTIEEAEEIYRQIYWVEPRFSTLNCCPILTEMVFDSGVLHGVNITTKMLQRSVGVLPDGILGRITKNAVIDKPDNQLGANFMCERFKLISRLVTNRPKQVVFIEGWVNRLCELNSMIPQMSVK